MANSYFQFKQFRIEQDQCAMKVSTDGCLLGALMDLDGATRLLDIGTGTGLLTLMAAQRCATATITAVEIDPAAAAQAAANAQRTSWANRIQVLAASLTEFSASVPTPFSHIICNPPFFLESLPAADLARNTARHASEASLSFEELASFAAKYLLPDGSLTVLLPPSEMARFETVAQGEGLFCSTRWEIRHRPGARVTRHICRFSRKQSMQQTRELLIHNSTGPGYSPDFLALLADFYLAL